MLTPGHIENVDAHLLMDGRGRVTLRQAIYQHHEACREAFMSMAPRSPLLKAQDTEPCHAAKGSVFVNLRNPLLPKVDRGSTFVESGSDHPRIWI